MQEQKTIHGFLPLRVRAFPELEGSLREYVHEKTGAQLCWLDRPDENKAFSIAFKTLPEDSTGVFHILEHAVLNGSDKYPVKEPFIELLKTSLQTFLNALTFSDKTVFPVSSRNDRDLLNLMDVYGGTSRASRPQAPAEAPASTRSASTPLPSSSSGAPRRR